MRMTGPPSPVRAAGPPPARGPVSEAISAAFATGPDRAPVLPATVPGDADPFGEDVQLALYLCYELHYRSFPGVDPAWEWDPRLLRLRAALEEAFLAELRKRTGEGDDVDEALAPLLVEPADGTGISHHLLEHGTLGLFREYVVHRSAYHLKEADPHAFLIPRLNGRAKAALVAVEFDEYGGGRAERMHSRLYADLMRGLGLDPAYGRYLPLVPAPMLATVNLMSALGLHRGRRGAMAGHFAAAEITTAPSAARLARALDRLGVSAPECALFYTEHVEADAVHEQLMRREVLGGLLADEPELASDVVFGIRATDVVEDLFTTHVMDAWEAGRTSLREPLPETVPAGT